MVWTLHFDFYIIFCIHYYPIRLKLKVDYGQNVINFILENFTPFINVVEAISFLGFFFLVEFLFGYMWCEGVDKYIFILRIFSLNNAIRIKFVTSARNLGQKPNYWHSQASIKEFWLLVRVCLPLRIRGTESQSINQSKPRDVHKTTNPINNKLSSHLRSNISNTCISFRAMAWK